MSRTPTRRALRAGVTVLLLAISAFPALTGRASGQESLSDLTSRLNAIQAELDASAAKIESAHTAEDELGDRLEEIEDEQGALEEKIGLLEKVAAKRARSLYMNGNTGLVEVLVDGAADFADLAIRAEVMSQVSMDGAGPFIELSRANAELTAISDELATKRSQHEAAEKALKTEAAKLQAQFDSVAKEYNALRSKLATASTPAPSGGGDTEVLSSSVSLPPISSGGMYCPVGGPVSFVDSWGAPRSGGRAHEGVDMMSAYGTPEIAITSGTITYAGYSSLGGNVMYLSGDDGNLYIYIHSATQLSGGHVRAGQQIGTVGDTGNAAGNPHLHFEFHPGGGGPVNPTPLASSVC
jgi:murein DD-endopeptidase MepM/ murein hydrolase activator NlpD